MIPAHWSEHRRDSDGELVGYLVPDGTRSVPVTLFGHPLDEALPPDDAAEVLEETGLSYLAERWHLRLAGRDEPIAVAIAEVGPERMTVRNADYGYEGDIGEPFELPVPTERLTRG